MSLIDLEGDTNFTLQNQSAVKGRKLGLCLLSLIFLSPRRVSPFLERADFHARSSFARSTIPEEKWGTSRSLAIRSGDTGQRSHCFDSCQLITTSICNQISPGLPNQLESVSKHWFPCGADRRSFGRSVYSHVITKFSGMGRFIYPKCSAAARELR